MKKLILYGAGNMGRKWIDKLGEGVFCIADRDAAKIGTEIAGKRIIGADELLKLEEDYVLFVTAGGKIKSEIVAYLKEKGLGDKIVSTPYFEEDVFIAVDACVADTELEGKNYIGDNAVVTQSRLGYGTYVSNNTTLQRVKIGRFSAIGSNVCNLLGRHPTTEFVSIHPAFYSVDNIIQYSLVQYSKYEEELYSENGYSVSIGNDVWIGSGVQILGGVKIADGSIIGAGALVTHDTEPYSINVGVPAKKIKYRFTQEIINKLCNLKWWEKDITWIEENAELFENVEEFLKHIDNQDNQEFKRKR